MNKKLLGILIGLLAVGSLASASTIACPGVSNVVTQLGPGLNNCNVAGATNVLFSNFSVSGSSGFTGATVGISNASNFTAGEINLIFQILTIPVDATSGDVFLTYQVTGGIQGVDLSFQGTPTAQGGGVRIDEIVCTTAFVGTACTGQTLANYSLLSTGQGVSDFRNFAPTQSVWIQKDIHFVSATMSQFQNSHAVPEPMTLSMMGLGLLGLGLARRRQQGKK